MGSWLNSGQEHGQHRVEADGTRVIPRQSSRMEKQAWTDPGGTGSLHRESAWEVGLRQGQSGKDMAQRVDRTVQGHGVPGRS